MTSAYPRGNSPDDPNSSAYLRVDSDNMMLSPDVSSTSTLTVDETESVLALEEEEDLRAAIQQSIEQYQLDALARAQRLIDSERKQRESTSSPRTPEARTASDYADRRYPGASARDVDAVGQSFFPYTPPAANRGPVYSKSQRASNTGIVPDPCEADTDFPSVTTRSTVSARDFDNAEAQAILQYSGYRRGPGLDRRVAFDIPWTPGSSSSAADAGSLSSRSDPGSPEGSPTESNFAVDVRPPLQPSYFSAREAAVSTSASPRGQSPLTYSRGQNMAQAHKRPTVDPTMNRQRSQTPIQESPTRTFSPLRTATPNSLGQRIPSRPILNAGSALSITRPTNNSPSTLQESPTRSFSPFRTTTPTSLGYMPSRPALNLSSSPSKNRSIGDSTPSAWRAAAPSSPQRSQPLPAIWHPAPRTANSRLAVSSGGAQSRSSASPHSSDSDLDYWTSISSVSTPSPPSDWVTVAQSSSSPVARQIRQRRPSNSTPSPPSDWVPIDHPSTPIPTEAAPEPDLSVSRHRKAKITHDAPALSTRVSIAESDVGSDIMILKESPPSTPGLSVTSSLPPYSLAPTGWQPISTEAGSSRIPDVNIQDTTSTGYPVDKKEIISFPLAELPAGEYPAGQDTPVMSALAAEQFRMHNSTDIFSDEKICPSCTSPSPLIYGDHGNGENITVKDLSEERLEQLLMMKCTNCARSFCRGCSKRTDTVCLTAGTCAQKCSCAVFEILSAYDQDVLKHLGNSGNYEAYLSKSCVVFCDTLAALMRYVDPTFTSKNSSRPRRSDGRGPAPNVAYLIHSSLLVNSIRHLLSKKSFSEWILIRSNLKMYGQLVKFLTGMIDEWGYSELALLRVCKIKKSCGLRKWMHRDGEIEFGDLQDPLVDLLQPFVDKNGPFMSQGSRYLGQNGIQLCESLARLSEAVDNLKSGR